MTVAGDSQTGINDVESFDFPIAVACPDPWLAVLGLGA